MQMLERQEVKDGSCPCIYRISQEGLPLILPHITRQRLRLSLADFKSFLCDRGLRIPRGIPYYIFQSRAATGAAAPEGGPVDAPPVAAGGSVETRPAATEPAGAAPLEVGNVDTHSSCEVVVSGAAAANKTPAGGPAEEEAALSDGGMTGFGNPVEGSTPPFIRDAKILEEVGRVHAGCCIVTLMCAR